MNGSAKHRVDKKRKDSFEFLPSYDEDVLDEEDSLHLTTTILSLSSNEEDEESTEQFNVEKLHVEKKKSKEKGLFIKKQA